MKKTRSSGRTLPAWVIYYSASWKGRLEKTYSTIFSSPLLDDSRRKVEAYDAVYFSNWNVRAVRVPWGRGDRGQDG